MRLEERESSHTGEADEACSGHFDGVSCAGFRGGGWCAG